MAVTKKVYLTYPKERVAEPVLCEMFETCRVRFNIRTASINDHMGIVAVELMAQTPAEIDRAVEFFRSRSVAVEPIEMDVIGG